MARSKSKQSSDSAQKGPGLSPPSAPSDVSAPGIGSAGNTTSGTSQSAKRGKQG